MSHLHGKNALVTGASRGIGKAIAYELASHGANVAITYSSSSAAAEAVVKELTAKGVKAVAIKADATKPEEIRGLVSKVAKELGGLDIVVNNAGVFVGSMLPDTTEEEFDAVMNVNIRAVFVIAQAASKVLKEGGRIINIGSCLGEAVRMPGIANYAMSKFAVAGFTRAWAQDLGPKGITVNCVQPGPTATDMNPEEGEFADGQRAMTALKRYSKPEEIAGMVAYLASPLAGSITGACISVDSGFLA